MCSIHIPLVMQHSKIILILFWVAFNCLSSEIAFAQGRIILNGATINLNQGAYLVVDNPSSEAITRTSGHIISEGENNTIKWNIGTATGTYSIPFGVGGCDCVPLTFTKTAGTGSGYFLFSTYATGWNNSVQLPTGVTNINGGNGTDNSTFAGDRFWQINAQGYTVKPALSNLEFTYRDSDNASPNTITESLLRAKRYNTGLNSWVDNLLSSSVNTTTNQLRVAAVDASNLHAWWMLGTLSTNRYWVAPSNSNSNSSTNWAETAGGTGNAGVPTIGDAIIFDGTSDFNCVLDSDLFASSLTVSPGFTGVITQGSNAITVNGIATFSGGTFNGGNADITVSSDFLISGTSFTAPSTTLDVKGNFSLTSGAFTHNDGAVKFSGTGGTQTITSAAALTFNNITVTNTSASPGVSVQSNENLKGVLTLTSNVNFDADGSSNTSIFKLLSTGDSPTQDAAVAVLPSGAQVSGKVTFQRFMSKEGFNSNKVYRYISSPIQNATVSDLQQEIPITGNFTGRNTCSGCVASSPSLYIYSEPVITDIDGNGVANLHDGFVKFPNAANTETFQPGKGYALYVRGNLLPTTSWDLRGPITTGNVTPVTFSLNYTPTGTLANDGWNLVGNPYPSAIDWNASSGWTKGNLETSIYVGDNSSATGHRFATWNGVVGTNGGSQYVASGQAFWVKGNGSGAPSLVANENVKAAGTQTTFFRQEKPSNVLRVIASKGTSRDETVIHFREDATEGFDSHADARKMLNTALNISSKLEDGNDLVINSVPFLNCNTTIPLSLTEVTPGNYRFDFTEYESFSQVISISLQDNFIDSTFNIKNGGYNFSVTSNPASYGASRFKIEFGSTKINTTLVAKTSAVCDGKDATITIDNPQPGILYTAALDSVEIPSISQAGVISITIPSGKLTAGENLIRIKSSSEHCDAVVENVVSVISEKLPMPSGQPAINCGGGSLVLVASGAPENGSYNWYEELTSGSPIAGQHTNTFTTPSIRKSKTYYVAALNSLGCEGERISVAATVVNIEPVFLTPTAFAISSSYAAGNQWYLDGEKLEDVTSQTIQPTQSGLYTVEVLQNGCLTTAETEFIITPNVESTIPTENEPGTPPQNEQNPVTSIPETIYPNDIVVSPNPIRETAVIEVPKRIKNISKVIIINGLGQIIGYTSLTETTKKTTGTIQLGGYPSGIYIIQIVTSSGVYERKVIKL